MVHNIRIYVNPKSTLKLLLLTQQRRRRQRRIIDHAGTPQTNIYNLLTFNNSKRRRVYIDVISG